LTGFAFAIKYTAGIFIAYAILFVVWRSIDRPKHFVKSFLPPLKRSLLLTTCALVMAGPWLIKNWIYLQNPLAPFAGNVFRNPHTHALLMEDFIRYTHGLTLADGWRLPRELAIWGDSGGGLLGPAFCALPLSLLALRSPAGRRLLVAATFAVIPFF